MHNISVSMAVSLVVMITAIWSVHSETQIPKTTSREKETGPMASNGQPQPVTGETHSNWSTLVLPPLSGLIRDSLQNLNRQSLKQVSDAGA